MGAAHARAIGPTCEVSGPRANERAHARCEERRQLARSEQFRMQLNWVNFQQCPQTLQFQQYGCAVRHGVGGIACDIRGKLAGRESCAATQSSAGSAASDVPAAWRSEYRRRKQPAQAPPRQIKGPRTGSH